MLAELRAASGSPQQPQPQPAVRQLGIDPAAVGWLRACGGVVDMELPLPDQGTALATMTRMDPLAPGSTITIMEPDGSTRAASPTVQIWRGRIAGDPDSDVFLGISESQTHGWITSGGTTSLITTALTAGHRRTITYNAALLGPGRTPLCAGAIDVPGAITPPPTVLVPAPVACAVPR